jgi:hypothetical protein
MLFWGNLFIGDNLLDIRWSNNDWMWVNAVSEETFEIITSSMITSGLEVEL